MYCKNFWVAPFSKSIFKDRNGPINDKPMNGEQNFLDKSYMCFTV